MNIGQYRILEKLGNGGMGTVYLGEHILLGRSAAIKILKPALSAHREVVERFFNEARATSAIADPGVVQVFDFGYHVDGTAYIVMELLEGEPLATRIHRLGKLAVGDALRIVRQVAGSLDAAHARGIVHRDLKPANIFLVRDAQAQGGERTKLLDFGICKLDLDGDPRLTGGDAMLGTPVYMAPEQCRNARLADQRADIYALGGVLFHMVTGRTPFQADNAGDFIAAHLTEAVPAPSLFADVPPAVDAVVLRCMEKSPDDRFQSMADLQAVIDELLASIPEPIPTEEVAPRILVRDGAVRAPTPAPSDAHRSWFVSATPLPMTLEPPPHAQRSRRGLLGILAIGAVVALVGTYLALTSEEPGTPVSEIVDSARSSVQAMTVAKPVEPTEPAPGEPKPTEPSAMPSEPKPAAAPSEPTPAVPSEPKPAAAPSEPTPTSGTNAEPVVTNAAEADALAEWRPAELSQRVAQTIAQTVLARPPRIVAPPPRETPSVAPPARETPPAPRSQRPAITHRPVAPKRPVIRPQQPPTPPPPVSKPPASEDLYDTR